MTNVFFKYFLLNILHTSIYILVNIYHTWFIKKECVFSRKKVKRKFQKLLKNR